MHLLRNAFNSVPFSPNQHGILIATTEDHLHAYEPGIMLNLAEVAYGGLMPAESKVFEQIMLSTVYHSVQICKAYLLLQQKTTCMHVSQE